MAFGVPWICFQAAVLSAPVMVAHAVDNLSINFSTVPALSVIGVAKGGTTDAHYLLVTQYGFVEGKSKELGCAFKGKVEALDCYSDLLEHCGLKKPCATIDSTPGYLGGFRTGPNVAALMARISPTTTIVVLLREPVSQIQSLHNHWAYRPGAKTVNPLSEMISHSVNTQIDMELEFLQGPGNNSLRVLLEPTWLFKNQTFPSALRNTLILQYMQWLDAAPGRCMRLNRSGQTPGRGCLTKPLILHALYYPGLLNWHWYFPERGRMAIIQSEAYYNDRMILFDLFPLSPIGGKDAVISGEPRNHKKHYSASSTVSTRNKVRLTGFFHDANQRVCDFLSLRQRSIIVRPAVDRSCWWL